MVKRWWSKLSLRAQDNVITTGVVLVLLGVAIVLAGLLTWVMGM